MTTDDLSTVIEDEVAAAHAEFERAFADPAYTPFELPELALDFSPGKESRAGTAPIRFSGSLLWDAEVKKAWEPAKYIPSVVRTAAVWGRAEAPGGNETFWRRSAQRSWMRGEYLDVIERVAIDHRRRRVVFLGRLVAPDEQGRSLVASTEQPLFFVEHSVAGTEDEPRIRWRMVHLTQQRDDRLLERLRRIDAADRIPEYVVIYAREQLGSGTPSRSGLQHHEGSAR